MNQNLEDIAASISYPALFHRWLKERGYDADAILSSAGIETQWFEDPEKKISTQHYVDVTQIALDVTGDPALGLHFGSEIPLSAHGYLGFALQASENGEDVIRLSCSYINTQFSGVQIDFAETERTLDVMVTSSFDDLVLYRYTVECCIASMASAQNVLRRMHALNDEQVGAKPDSVRPFLQIQFDYTQPDYRHTYEQIFPNTKLFFDATANKVSLDRKSLKSAFSFGNRVVRQLAVEQCEADLRAMQTSESYADKVRQLMTKDIGRHHNLEQVAAQLNVSGRVLSRRLNEEETSFQDLLDEVRKQLAIKLLRTTKLTVSEIAYRLNYEHPNNFTRAFKKWTQKSPSDYR